MAPKYLGVLALLREQSKTIPDEFHVRLTALLQDTRTTEDMTFILQILEGLPDARAVQTLKALQENFQLFHSIYDQQQSIGQDPFEIIIPMIKDGLALTLGEQLDNISEEMYGFAEGTQEYNRGRENRRKKLGQYNDYQIVYMLMTDPSLFYGATNNMLIARLKDQVDRKK